MESKTAVFSSGISLATIELLLYPCRVVSYTLIDGVRKVHYIPTLSLMEQKEYAE